MTPTTAMRGILVVATLASWSCNTTTQGTGAGADGGVQPGGGANGGGTSGGGTSGGGTSGGGTSGSGAGGSGAGGAATGGAGGKMGMGGMGGVASCTPGVEQTIITDCGYPSASSSPLSSVVFNESEVLRAIVPSGGAPTAVVRVFYNDEHALTLGVRQVVTKGAAGPTTTDYPVSPLMSVPSSVIDPKTGTNELVGPQSGLDVSLRPMWPVLYITDITADPKSRSGDWQMGGRPLNPNAIHGTWKGAVRTVDTTTTPNKITITPDKDPMKNDWNLGGGDPVPAGLKNEGFGAEVVWNVPLIAGHSYRLQTMVHDGDQNKEGGDSGEACVLFCAGGPGPAPGADAGVPPPPMCPAGTTPCAQDSIDPGHCAAPLVCANGCCVPLIP